MEALYHYCQNDSFISILNSKSVWLSSLSQANDSLEGRVLSNLICELGKSDGYTASQIRDTLGVLLFIEKNKDGLALCLSEQGDLLSQWRSYAGDGAGVAIGFSLKYLYELGHAIEGNERSTLEIIKVKYSREAQEKLVMPAYLKIRELLAHYQYVNELMDNRDDSSISQDKINWERSKLQKIYYELKKFLESLFRDVYRVKSDAFYEEKEWRVFFNTFSGDSTNFSYRAKNNRIVPYFPVNLMKLEENPILEVILGPKNATPTRIIEELLKNSGFDGVRVKRSRVSYR